MFIHDARKRLQSQPGVGDGVGDVVQQDKQLLVTTFFALNRAYSNSHPTSSITSTHPDNPPRPASFSSALRCVGCDCMPYRADQERGCPSWASIVSRLNASVSRRAAIHLRYRSKNSMGRTRQVERIIRPGSRSEMVTQMNPDRIMFAVV